MFSRLVPDQERVGSLLQGNNPATHDLVANKQLNHDICCRLCDFTKSCGHE